MSSLGIRCFPDRYVYVILDGTQNEAIVVDKGICKIPTSKTKASSLQWVRHDIQELLTRHSVDSAFIKTVEGNSRTKDPDRLHIEGVVIESSASHQSGPETATVVVSQIKKKTGFTSLAKYLSNLLSNTHLQEVSTGTYSDAALAALCGLTKE